jgi:hypothetical protein
MQQGRELIGVEITKNTNYGRKEVLMLTPPHGAPLLLEDQEKGEWLANLIVTFHTTNGDAQTTIYLP